ncbi:MAG: hypothetical protein HY801_08985 [Candidatus Lindowbacteria bacterium]|nr:hypothetical protein [Candidatus Lindowbacteria bacterium]
MLNLDLANSKRRFHTRAVFLAFGMLFGLFVPEPAMAHKVNVFAYVEGNTVVTDCYFNDGRKCQGSIIEVFDEKGNKLLEGKTDAEGRFSFQPPVRTNLLIRLSASMGHQAEFQLPTGDLPESLPATAKPAAEEKAPARSPREPPRSMEKPSLKTSGKPFEPNDSAILQLPPSVVDIEQAVDKALARQLAPIHRDIKELQRKQRFSDIAGGIGYIVGLMGLAAYFHSRRRREKG